MLQKFTVFVEYEQKTDLATPCFIVQYQQQMLTNYYALRAVFDILKRIFLR